MNQLLLPIAAGAALGALAGYCTGRFSVGTRLADWAEHQAERLPLWHPLLAAAVVVLLAATAAAWIVHPRQTAANRQFWREQRALRGPLPAYDRGRVQRHISGL